MDRERMRSLVFADASTRRRLEGILHPMIGIECERQSALSAATIKVFDVPLLVESGHWRNRVDRVLVVDCSEATQIERVVQRPGWTTDAARAVIAQQASRDARRACADAVIVNDGMTAAELAAEVRDLWGRWCAVA
jgi:dephospho-CoA kinase